MANVKITIPLAGATATIPGAISDNYIIEDSGVMLANYVLTATTPVSSNRVITVWYKGGLDVTTNNTNIFLFGHDITQERLSIDGIFTFSWNGATWDMIYVPDFEENNIVSTSMLSDEGRVRHLSVTLNYDSTVSPQTQTLINPYIGANITKMYIRECTLLDADAELFIAHGVGFLPYIVYTSATNGVTISTTTITDDTLTVPSEMVAGSYSEIEITNTAGSTTSTFWEISQGGLATTGSIELILVFQV